MVVFAGACSSSTNSESTDASSNAGGANGGASSGGASSGGGNGGSAAAGGTGGDGPSTGGVSNAAGNRGQGFGSGGKTSDAGSDADARSSASDPCATALYCETFEGYPAGSPPVGDWKTQTNSGAVSVVDTQRFAGQKSAMFTTQASSGGKTAYIRLDSASVFPVAGNAYYGRMMTRLESAPDQSVHWTFIESGGLVAGQNYHALYRYGGQHPVTQNGTFVGSQLMANYDTPDSYSGTGPSSDCWNHANGTVLPVTRWVCVEWQFDGPTDTLRFWLEGAAVDSLTVQGVGQGCVHQPQTFEWSAPTFDHLELGWESYQADSERTLYIDDIVIAKNRIGCPPAP